MFPCFDSMYHCCVNCFRVLLQGVVPLQGLTWKLDNYNDSAEMGSRKRRKHPESKLLLYITGADLCFDMPGCPIMC